MQAEKPTDEQLTAIANQTLQKLKTAIDNPKWEAFNEKPCRMLKMEHDGRLASRGETKVNFPADKVFQFLMRDDSLKKLNPQLEQSQTVHTIKAGQFPITVERSLYNAPWPVAQREFVAVVWAHKEGDTYYITSESCNYPITDTKKAVRGIIFVGGFRVTAIDQNSCYVVYISDADPQGSIPGMVKDMSSKKQGEVVSRIEETMKK